ncbi:hypothetical protein CI109_104512 [Kwoniella shandongensis]|uniref:Uncharacterized protein n=1 Tax=Kwoniella shandongensis TaxID=1734106 RepID=A0A5M6BQ52_9TREE|nr:uncharacterized protein CI109_007404 [Kwoniella shandongensis]KAA5524252.1 hypothetical protein CI109_007404 [Kwoniella shandongensis]
MSLESQTTEKSPDKSSTPFTDFMAERSTLQKEIDDSQKRYDDIVKENEFMANRRLSIAQKQSQLWRDQSGLESEGTSVKTCTLPRGTASSACKASASGTSQPSMK